MDMRKDQLSDWCTKKLGNTQIALAMVSGDASFRRYFRVHGAGKSLIAMDAPPELEDSSAFLAIAQVWREAGIAVPEILAYELEKGFLLLSDFGDRVLLNELYPASPDVQLGDRYYKKAIDELLHIQVQGQSEVYPLPPYDRALLEREMALFKDWLLVNKLGLELSRDENDMLDQLFELMINNALAQPQVCVHRDYHSRNLMCLPDGNLGVLDFQDAVIGPASYDLVSLLRDCYIVWPVEKVDAWCRYYFDSALARQILSSDFELFMQQFDWMGMQRHLKASGIFARLSLRDGKHAYLNDIPRTLNYLLEVSKKYEQTRAFGDWLSARVLPVLDKLEAA